MTRMNWTAENSRRRIRDQGAATVNGAAFGGNAPAARPGPPPARRSPSLPEPVQVGTFWKNRRHDAIVVTLSTFEGRNLVDLRQHFMNKEGKLQPTQKGVAMVVLRLPDLAKAVNAALSKARELGLLDGQDEASEATP
jgi:Transcriptional Coactivator p15 (PC4)